jgi:HEAT repeat protein
MRAAVWMLLSVAMLSLSCKKKVAPADAGGAAVLAAADAGSNAAPDWRAGLKSADAKLRAAACLSVLPVDHPKAPPELVDALGDADPSVRKAALKGVLGFELKYSDASALPALLKRIGQETVADVRVEVVRVVGALAHRDVVPALAAHFPKEKDPLIRDEILTVFGREGDIRALDVLRPLLKEKVPPPSVFEAIRKIGDPRVIPDLQVLLNSPSGAMRSRAVQALGDIGGETVVQLVKKALGDSDPGVVREAIRSAAKVGTAELVSPLLGLVDNADPKIRARAIRALGVYPQPELVPANDAIPRVLKRLEKDDLEVQLEAARVLGRMRVRRALTALTAAAGPSAPKPLRLAAVEALGQVGDPSVVKPLLAAFGEKERELRFAATRAIGHAGKSARAASSVLREALKKGEADIDLRIAIARALGRIGARGSAAQLLLLGEKDPVPLVRAEAGGALLVLGDVRGLRVLRPILMSSPDWQERRSAARAVPIEARVKGIAALVSEAISKEQEPLVRETLFRKLGDAKGANARQFQRKALKEQIPSFRLMAADGLCGNGDPAGCGVLAGALRDPDAIVRAEAARRLGMLRAKSALAALKAVFDDPVVAVANAARRAVARIEGSESAPGPAPAK